MISFAPAEGSLALVRAGRPLPILIRAEEGRALRRAAGDLRADFGRVCGTEPPLVGEPPRGAESLVIVGTIGANPLFDELEAAGELDLSELRGRRESFAAAIVERPLPGVGLAFVIAGSDARGAIYGIYELSARIGVSPWYWWADVPVIRRSDICALPGPFIQRESAVRYRGIFLNDEEPCLGRWARERFGGFNAAFYSKVFELLLRLKGNYLWPAMWGKAFHDDDPANADLASAYGVVMGTSHHEPMGRAHDEWRRYGSGSWSFARNAKVLSDFWKAGMERLRDRENIVTVGMRGDGDEPMGASTDMALLERVIAEQRRIIAESTSRDPAETPQLWAIYKEVQDYYDAGMRGPDDVTLLFCDDNWGNLRALPGEGERARPGGSGIYYHFDYVGGPRNYKWLDTVQIPRVWEQMGAAFERGADRIWIVNVGDLKPIEMATEFFLEYAWSPPAWGAEAAAGYPRAWAARQFGPDLAERIGAVLTSYSRLAALRKPELVESGTFGAVERGEADRIAAELASLEAEARDILSLVPLGARDSFAQLVLHRTAALGNLHALYAAVAKNRAYAKQGRAAANAMADEAERLFARDAELSRGYNELMSGGKWNHMMDQTHIGYSGWQQPDADAMPALERITPLPGPAMGIDMEGPELPELDSRLEGGVSIELFSRGSEPFAFRVRSEESWLRASPDSGLAADTARILVEADWPALAAGVHEGRLLVEGPLGDRGAVELRARAFKAPPAPDGWEEAFAEIRGTVAVEAGHCARAIGAPGAAWTMIPGLGRGNAAMRLFPYGAGPFETDGRGPRLEYRVLVRGSGRARVLAYHSPSLDTGGRGRLAYAVSFDDGPPALVDARADRSPEAWERSVADNVLVSVSAHELAPGPHVLKYWAVDAALVLQRILVAFGGEGKDPPAACPGPPESPWAGGGAPRRGPWADIISRKAVGSGRERIEP